MPVPIYSLHFTFKNFLSQFLALGFGFKHKKQSFFALQYPFLLEALKQFYIYATNDWFYCKILIQASRFPSRQTLIIHTVRLKIEATEKIVSVYHSNSYLVDSFSGVANTRKTVHRIRT